jgi:cytochrome b6-f complex iron-sulfur subunit
MVSDMANPKKMSVQEILAACKKADGAGGGAKSADAPESEPAAESPAAETETAEAAAPEAAPAEKKPAPAKKGGKLSVAEMLAAARAEKSDGAKSAAAAEPAEEAPAAEKPKAKAPAAAKTPGKMSVTDMLAAARAEKTGGTKAPAEKPAPKASPKPAAAAAKGAAPAEKKPAAAAKSSGPKDTGSILSDARKSAKPGPMTKAEAAAAAKQQESPGAKPGKPKIEAPPMPEKPGYARPATPAPAPSDRRNFMSAFVGLLIGTPLAVGFSTLAVTNLLWLLGLARFMFPNILIEPPTKFKVGFPDELAPGQVQEKYKALFGVWIVRYEYEGQAEIYALKTVCTHLGCTPNWLEGEQKFKCPCHGSGFYKDGINFEGPAPRPLERYAIRLSDDGQLEVDKSRTFFEEKGDWKDPSSFVAV